MSDPNSWDAGGSDAIKIGDPMTAEWLDALRALMADNNAAKKELARVGIYAEALVAAVKAERDYCLKEEGYADKLYNEQMGNPQRLTFHGLSEAYQEMGERLNELLAENPIPVGPFTATSPSQEDVGVGGDGTCTPMPAVTPDGWCEWTRPAPGYRMQCCDCGLVHEVQFNIVTDVQKAPDGALDAQPIDDPRLSIFFRMRREKPTASIPTLHTQNPIPADLDPQPSPSQEGLGVGRDGTPCVDEIGGDSPLTPLGEAAERAASTLLIGIAFAGKGEESFNNWRGHAEMVVEMLEKAGVKTHESDRVSASLSAHQRGDKS